MIHILLALLKKLANSIVNFIHKLEAKFKNVDTEVKSDVAGLQKFVTLKSLSIDADGNYSVNLSCKYQDAAGNEMNYSDPAKQNIVLTGTAPDKSVDPSTYSPEQVAQNETANAIIAALTPAIKAAIPDVV